MKPVIVADTGPLIALAKLHQLPLLPQLFSDILLPETVFREATVCKDREDVKLIEAFTKQHLRIMPDIDNSSVFLQGGLLDEGETQVLALAEKLRCGVLMDERRGRRAAHYHRIPVVGVLGVLLQAKEQNIIPKIKPLLKTLQTSGYRLSHGLIEHALKQAGER